MSTEPTYEERVEAMEQEGMTTSDAQGVVDAEIKNAKTHFVVDGRKFDTQLDAAIHLLSVWDILSYPDGSPADGPRFRQVALANYEFLKEFKEKPIKP